MANQGRRSAKGAGRGAPARGNRAAAPARRSAGKKTTGKKTTTVVFDAPQPEPEAPRTFRLGAVPGATPGKWIDAWKQRMPQVPLDLVPIEVATQRAALDGVDAALVRLPLTDESLHIIALYEELPVVVAAVDSHLMAAEQLTPADLDGEVVIALADDVLGPLQLPGAQRAEFAPLPTDEAIATAASGVGVVIVPMSLARLHHRKDADHRVLTEGPTSTVALAWPRERTTPDVETFVGIVRGRTANSSR